MKWGIHFDLTNKREKVEEIEAIMQAPDFWDNMEKAQNYVKELNTLKNILADYKELEPLKSCFIGIFLNKWQCDFYNKR